MSLTPAMQAEFDYRVGWPAGHRIANRSVTLEQKAIAEKEAMDALKTTLADDIRGLNAMAPVYRIRNWGDWFENHESKKLKNLNWVLMRNKHDGRGYRRVTALRNSVQVFCGWVLLVQVASKMPTRGVLCDDDGALTAADLAAKTGFPEVVFTAAFEALVKPGIQWLEVERVTTKSGDSPDTSGTFGDEQNRTEQKGTEGNYYHKGSRTVLHFLNEQCGRHFRETDSNLGFITARLREEGVTVEGVMRMIQRQCARWKGTGQEEYLRPETLFNKTKFDGYYAAKDLPISPAGGAPEKPPTLLDKEIERLKR